MTRADLLVQVGLRTGRWMLPWVAVMFVSATLAYALDGAIAGDPSTRDWRPDLHVAVSTGEAAGPTAVERSTTSQSTVLTDLDPSAPPEGCAPIDNHYVDTSIVAESRRIVCGQGVP